MMSTDALRTHLGDPSMMADDARLAEVARLLARGWLRARVRATARPVRPVAPIVAKSAPPAPEAPVSPAETALALCSEAEPPCPHESAGAVPATFR
jgi:hypothetical protein